jgi:hypothetical protein
MKAVRVIASFLYHLTSLLSILYLLTGLYSLVVIMVPGMPIRVTDGVFEIYYPFTKSPFLLGDYTRSFFTTMWLTTFGYGIFLWLLSRVFKTFKQQKLFTSIGVKRLSAFYIVNLVAPITILILLAIAGQGINEMIIITGLHAILGIFAFFMAAIFKQGLLLQEEQDLTL